MEIYAELTRKQLASIESVETEICFPSGIKLSRRKGSRACYFQCDDVDSMVSLIDGL